MKNNNNSFIAAKRIGMSAPNTFTWMNKQFMSNTEINHVKPYLNSVAVQNHYKIAATRAQLALGLIYAQKAHATKWQTKQFYACKAKQYLSAVALQDLYPKGQQCALTILRLLNRESH